MRFSSASGEVDEVPAVFVDAGRITCVTPARITTHDAHVAVSNNGVAFSSFPLVDLDEGTYLHFSFVNTKPVGSWVLDVAAGSHKGGTSVTIYDENHRSSTRHADLNFLPGKHLRCRFGNARNVSDINTFNISVRDKTNAHPRFGVGYHKGYVIYALSSAGSATQHAVHYEGSTLTLIRGRAYVFSLDSSTDGFPFFFSTEEPSQWAEDSFVGEYTYLVSNTRAEGVSTFNVALDANTPNTLYYACGKYRAMGGVINVIDEANANDNVANNRSGPLFSNRNTVPAVWENYNKIVCVTPPWDGTTDDDTNHGGHQVTVFVSNDGVEYSAGFGDLDGVNPDNSTSTNPWSNYPAKVGQGTTFTYFDSNAFVDAPRFTPSTSNESVSIALKGGPSANPRLLPNSQIDYASSNLSADYFYAYASSNAHSFSDVYDDFGGKREFQFNDTVEASEAFGNTSDVLALLSDSDPSNDPSINIRNNLKISGTFTGDGLAWFEIVVDGVSVNSTTVRWRKHVGAMNLTVPWQATNVEMPEYDLLSTPDTVEGISLGDGLTAGFLKRGAHHFIGDRWTFRVFGGTPGVTSIATTHDEPRIDARGPMEGLTEVTLYGSGFFPGKGQLLCKFADADFNDPESGNVAASEVVMTVEALSYDPEDHDSNFDSSAFPESSPYRKITCVTERHAYVNEGMEILSSLSPCVNKTVTVSFDGGASWSSSDKIFFLFCDVFVSVSGSDVVGVGTPKNPYKTLQRAVEASLARPKFPEKQKQRTFQETAAEKTYSRNAGFGMGINTESMMSVKRSRSSQSKNPGYGYVLNRDKVSVAAGTYAGNGNRGVHPLGKMIEITGKRFDNVVIDCEDSGVGATVSAGDRHASDVGGAIVLAGVLEVNCNERSV